MTQRRTLTVLATHRSSDLDGYASLVALRYLFPGAVLALDDNLQEIVYDVVSQDPPPLPVISVRDVDPRSVAVLVVTDLQDLSRIAPWAEDLAPDTEVVVFDHHPLESELRSRENTVMHWGAVGSTCTLVTEALATAGIDPSAHDATLLLAGLYEDTGQLAYQTATERDFAAALTLVRWGAQPADAGDMLQKLWNSRQTQVLADLQANVREVEWGNLRAAISRADLPFFVPDIAALVPRMRLGEADAVFVLAGIPEKVFLVARALRAGVDVSGVARALGGGGHAEAASAVMHHRDLVEAEEELLTALTKQGEPVRTAADLMTTPPIGLDAGSSIDEAGAMLARNRIGTLLVFEGGAAAALLDYGTVASALEHGLGTEAVGPYCRRPLQFVDPTDSLNRLRRRLYDTGERLYAVGSSRNVLGVVTRRDILRAVYEETLPPESEAPMVRSRDLSRDIRGQLGETADRHLRRLGELAERLGAHVYLVGGCVRDLMLRKHPVDWDLVAVGDPEALLDQLRAEGASIKLHGRFRTANVRFDDGLHFDLATARRETYARPGALPVVEPASLTQDLYRRDFSMNALAVDLGAERYGRLIDQFRGLEDLKRKRIRVLHSLSFVDDPTRAFRALRLAVRFGFEVAESTLRLIERAAALRIFADSEGSRLRRELVLAFYEAEPLAVLRAFDTHGLLEACVAGYRLAPAEPYVRAALEWTAWYRLQFGADVDHADTLRLGSLTLGAAGAGGARGREILTGFKARPGEVERWVAFRSAAGEIEHAAARLENPTPSRLVELLDRHEHEVLLLWAVLHGERREYVTKYLTEWRQVHPLVTGRELIEAGIPAGPEVGRWLAMLRKGLLDGTLPADRATQLETVLELRSGGGGERASGRAGEGESGG